MVQKEQMMSLASSDMGGSWGNVTGFSTILIPPVSFLLLFGSVLGPEFSYCLYISIGFWCQNGGYPVRNS